MAKVTFQDEEGQYLNRYKLTPVEGQVNVFDLERMAAITKQGTPYSKEIMDHMLQVEDKGVPGGCAELDANGSLKQMPTAAQIGAMSKYVHVIIANSNIVLTAEQSGSLVNAANDITITLPPIASYAQYDIHCTGRYTLDGPDADIYDNTLDIAGKSITYTGEHMITVRSYGNVWVINSSNDARRAMYASGPTPLAASALRNTVIIPKTSSIPTGLADGTVVMRYTP